MQPSDNFSATVYANSLLASLGEPVRCVVVEAEPHPAQRYAESGLLALTGTASAPQIFPLPLATCADGVIAALQTLSGNWLGSIDGAALLGERAALAGFTRAGAVSVGDSCRWLAASDGWLALNLARDDDWELLPAWLEIDEALKIDAQRSWDVIAAVLLQKSTNDCIERGRLLGLAIAALEQPNTKPCAWQRIEYQHSVVQKKVVQKKIERAPLVVDLSSLWAGPLCSHLLQQLGARVLKVESSARPDGARRGNRDFYNLLNANKESVALDFATEIGRAQLRALCARADIVIEASRPRALRQLGIVAEELIELNPALTWLSITGYGRSEPEANWIAFGDDAAVAAGLSSALYAVCGKPLFCGDAIADPLTGMHAALAAWQSYRNGGGRLIALALRDVVAHCIQFSAPNTPELLRTREQAWRAVIAQKDLQATLPVTRQPQGIARELGADTLSVLTELGIAC